MSNAIKFTSKGNISLVAKVNSIDQNTANIYFAVKDTGIGIPKEKLEDIFQEFTQASSNTARRYGGTGLGLGIAKKLVALFGSQLKVKSTEGVGSVFYFDIDLPLANKLLINIVAQPVSEVCVENCLLGTNILIAEDNKVNQMVISRILKKWNANITIADDGRLAVEAVKQNDFDIILMDIQMPNMDGIDATREIRLLEAGKREIPIIAVTASMQEVKGKLDEYGMNDVISKPFLPQKLYDAITKTLSQQSRTMSA